MAPSLLDRQAFSREDYAYRGSKIAELRTALFENAYFSPWPGIDNAAWPKYRVTFGSLLRGIASRRKSYQFLEAAKRTLDSKADLRWGPDGLGFRRLLHPNGICLFGKWIIDQKTNFSGYFCEGSEGRLVTRYSTCCTEPTSNKTRSLSLVGKLFPTQDPLDQQLQIPASFITQEDLGGTDSKSIAEIELRNAPDTTFYKRGWDTPILVLTGLTFLVADREPAFRQLYEIAELGTAPGTVIRAPRFLRFVIDELSNPINRENLDFRDEIMAQIYEPNNPEPKRKLIMHIEVSDTGTSKGPMLLQKRKILDWQRIGRIEFDEAVASYNGDFVVHFHHPTWRTDRNSSQSAIRQERTRTGW